MSSRSESPSSSEDDREQSTTGETQTSAQNKKPADDQISVTETNTIRSSSPTLSHKSETTTQHSFDAVSINTTTSTNATGATVATTTATDVKKPEPNNIPIIRAPVLPGPAQSQQQQQPRPDTGAPNRLPVQGAVGGNTVNQTRTQTNIQFNPGQQQQQAQFPNQIPANQVYNELLGPDAFKDVMLNIDYGALDAYNIGIQAPYTVPSAQATGGQGYGEKFDVAKALFRQIDTNQDGSISREEFGQWAQRGSQNFTGQSYGNVQAVNGQPRVTEYEAKAMYGNNFAFSQLFDGATPEIANILRQSGING